MEIKVFEYEYHFIHEKYILKILTIFFLEFEVKYDPSQVNCKIFIKKKVTNRLCITNYPKKIVFVILINILVSDFIKQSTMPFKTR